MARSGARLRPDVPPRHRHRRESLTSSSNAWRRLAGVSVVILLLTTALSAWAAPAAAADRALASFTVTGSPFAADFAPLPTAATISATLNRGATVSVTIRRPSGRLVRSLATNVAASAGTTAWSWDGRNDSGAVVRDGQYVARIAVHDGPSTTRANRPVRKGLPPIYPVNPGALVVVVDAGHGGRFPGAVNGPSQEKNYNLAIALQLQALLLHAGVQVVMTRTTDVAVNQPASDLNGDGVLDRYDDDLARNDIANEARADIAVHVHNNGAPNVDARGTEAFTDGQRTWTPSGLQLAGDVLSGVAGTLASYRSATFQPVDAGVHEHWYYYMGPYDPPFLIRAALMTSVLSESLFMTNAAELDALKRPDIQQAIAAGIYIGIARYLNTRDYGIGYDLVSAPSSVVAGSPAQYKVRITNRGNLSSSGWTLDLASVPAVPLYDGSGAHGTSIGSAPIPDGLAPGKSVVVTVNATAPASAGSWLVKADVVLPGGAHLADAGIAPLQVALATTIGR